MALKLKSKPTTLAKPLAKPGIKKLAAPAKGAAKPLAKPGAAKKPATSGFATATQLNAQNKAQAEQRKHQPFRFRMKQGEERKIILTDRKEPFFLYEHHYQTKGGKWNGFARCIKDQGVCPACKALDREGRYLMMLSCIDLSQYTDRDGKVHKSSKKLLPVPLTLIPKFERLFKKHNGNLRGVVLQLNRDSDKSPACGSDFEELKVLSEADLAKYKEKADPVDFSKAFPPVTEKELAAQFSGGRSLPGSEDIDDEGEVGDELPF